MKSKYVTPITRCVGNNPTTMICVSLGGGEYGNGIPAEAQKRTHDSQSTESLFATDDLIGD